jgi:signal transduction histidine kinase
MPTATHLYRIAQEAVNNAVKYSGAREISIQLAGSADGINLVVRDDGKWSNQKATRRSGMGMHIMQYRAQLIGGNWRCEGGASGTVISCHVPRALRKTSL